MADSVRRRPPAVADPRPRLIDEGLPAGYKPPFDRRALNDEDITGYTVSVSQDGVSFQQVEAGSWEASMATKMASWKPAKARYVRLTALSSDSGVAAAREVNLGSAPCS